MLQYHFNAQVVRLITPPLAAAKHAAFVRARGRHYSNEAEAMKVCHGVMPYHRLTADILDQRAKSLLDDEEEEEETASVDPHADTDSHMSVDSETEVKVNGVVHAE